MIVYNQKIYRDDRLFVLNLTKAKVNYDSFSAYKWTLNTYHNTQGLEFFRSDSFENEISAIEYLKINEPLTPLISNKEKPLEIPKDKDKWRYWIEWLRNNKLFSAIEGRQNVPLNKNPEGYIYHEYYFSKMSVVNDSDAHWSQSSYKTKLIEDISNNYEDIMQISDDNMRLIKTEVELKQKNMIGTPDEKGKYKYKNTNEIIDIENQINFNKKKEESILSKLTDLIEKALGNGNYEIAIDTIKKLHYPWARNEMGEILMGKYRIPSIERDFEQAKNYLELAAAHYYAPAMINLSREFYDLGPEKDYKKSYELLSNAVSYNQSSDACARLGEKYLYGIGLQTDYSGALYWFLAALIFDNFQLIRKKEMCIIIKNDLFSNLKNDDIDSSIKNLREDFEKNQNKEDLLKLEKLINDS